MEHIWTSGTANQIRIRAVEVGARNLILANVESTWVQELSAPGTFYILNHLEKDGSSLDRPAGVELILGLNKLWEADPRVAQFIINMEEAQKKLVRAQLPIKDKMLAAFATFMLLKSNSFPRNRPVWDGKPVEDQRWVAWKELFEPLQLAFSFRQCTQHVHNLCRGSATPRHSTQPLHCQRPRRAHAVVAGATRRPV